jgi:hypothetical protein
VQVGLVVLRRVVVHDQGDPLDVESASGDVGRDQDVDRPFLEAPQRALSVAL